MSLEIEKAKEHQEKYIFNTNIIKTTRLLY